MRTASSVYGSIFHFHHTPRGRPTPYSESRRFSINPSVPCSRLCARACASVSQLGALSSVETRKRVSPGTARMRRSEEHTSELQSRSDLVCRLLLEKKK